MSAQPSPAHQLRRTALEIAPLVVFFVANARGEGIEALFDATAAFMVATVIALSLSWVLERRIPILPLVSGAFVLGFGALTLILEDELFIKMKPTIVNLLFAAILAGGLAFGRSLLKPLLDAALSLTDRGWRVLTVRWAFFFVFLAILNEVVWRGFSTDFWAGFKLFGVMPITLIFAFAQAPLIKRESVEMEEPSEDAPEKPGV